MLKWFGVGGLLALAALAIGSGAPALAASSSDARAQVRTMFDIYTKMRDGVELASDVWLPAQPGRYPIILIRTPYLKAMPEISFPSYGRYFAQHGYAFVVQDVRGRGDSGGQFDFFFQEADDGYDTIEGLAKLPWSNGRVCMMGISYLGTVQWLAAKEQPPHLVCMAPSSPGARFMDELPYLGGAFGMRWALSWLNGTSGKINQDPNTEGLDWDRIFAHRPLLTMDEAMGRKMPLYREFLQHDTLDAYWRRIRLGPEDFAKINIPILDMTGTFDGDQLGALYVWSGVERYAPASRSNRFLIIGPWQHVQTFLGGALNQGEFKLSPDSVLDVKKIDLEFFDRYLKQDASVKLGPRVRVYVTGRDVWRSFDEFPPRIAKSQRLFFSSGGHANTGCGDGKLSWAKPKGPSADEFTYDPKNPAHVLEPYAGVDRRPIEQRHDVLVYTSEPLKQPVEVIGPVTVELYAASDALDTDFTANIVDVFPDGRAAGLGPDPVGILRARYRHGLEKTELLHPGKVTIFRIDLGSIAHSFQPGHRIRIEISSSAYPFFNPNQNTGNPVATDTDWKVAHQKIMHTSRWPSAVVLPVVTP